MVTAVRCARERLQVNVRSRRPVASSILKLRPPEDRPGEKPCATARKLTPGATRPTKSSRVLVEQRFVRSTTEFFNGIGHQRVLANGEYGAIHSSISAACGPQAVELDEGNIGPGAPVRRHHDVFGPGAIEHTRAVRRVRRGRQHYLLTVVGDDARRRAQLLDDAP